MAKKIEPQEDSLFTAEELQPKVEQPEPAEEVEDDGENFSKLD